MTTRTANVSSKRGSSSKGVKPSKTNSNTPPFNSAQNAMKKTIDSVPPKAATATKATFRNTFPAFTQQIGVPKAGTVPTIQKKRAGVPTKKSTPNAKRPTKTKSRSRASSGN